MNANGGTGKIMMFVRKLIDCNSTFTITNLIFLSVWLASAFDQRPWIMVITKNTGSHGFEPISFFYAYCIVARLFYLNHEATFVLYIYWLSTRYSL